MSSPSKVLASSNKLAKASPSKGLDNHNNVLVRNKDNNSLASLVRANNRALVSNKDNNSLVRANTRALTRNKERKKALDNSLARAKASHNLARANHRALAKANHSPVRASNNNSLALSITMIL